MDMNILDIESLRNGIPFISDGWFHLYKEKCMVAFSSQGHENGVPMKITVNGNIKNANILWEGEINQQLIDSHADSKKTTDDAACAIALLIIREFTDYTAYKTTDASGERVDYYLKPQSQDQDETLIFNNTAYLEVSGIRRETPNNSVKKRLKEKKDRAKSSIMLKDAEATYICIVEFSKPLSVTEEVSCLLV